MEKHFTTNGIFNRFMVRFFKQKVNVREPLDIRYKWTNGKNQLVIKKGALGTQSRQELTIELGKENQLTQVVHMLSWMGYTVGLAIYRDLYRFDNGTIESTLGIAYPYHFIEIEALERKNKQKALKDIAEFCQKMQITPFTKSQYQSFLRMTDKKVNFKFALSTFPDALEEIPFWREKLKQTGFTFS